MKFPILSLLLALTPLISATHYPRNLSPVASQKVIPATAVTGPITANFLSTPTGLDSPQLSAVNASAWDWWYFDAVSPDASIEINIVFFTALSSGFPSLSNTSSVTVASFSATFANGTTFNAYLEASEAIVTSIGNGASGTWITPGENWGFEGASDLGEYRICIDSPSQGIKGTFELRSRAPAHYPCGPVGGGVNMEVGPNIGWSNAVPDADGWVDFLLDGSEYQWEGVAYHDKNWSDQTFVENVGSWFWGHGRLGEYSIVWFDFLAPNGTEYVSGYAAKDGKIILASCQAGSIKVRPTGANDAYPPVAGVGPPGGFSIELDLGAEGTFNVDFNLTTQALTSPSYNRMLGSLKGSINGGKEITGGVALCEEFILV